MKKGKNEARYNVRIYKPILEKDHARVDAPSLIEGVFDVPRPLVDAHDPDVGTAPQGLFHPDNRIVRIRIWSARTRVHVQYAQFRATNRPGEFRASVDGHLLAGHRIDANVPAEEQLVLIAEVEAENSRVFQKKWALSGMKTLKGERLNGSRSTSVSAKSVSPVRFKTKFELRPYLTSRPPVKGNFGSWPVCLLYCTRP